MIYAQLYHRSTGWNGKDFSGPVKAIPMCGSDSVVYLDGRKSVHNLRRETEAAIEKHMRKSSITGYQIVRARNFREDGHKLTGVISFVKPPLEVG